MRRLFTLVPFALVACGPTPALTTTAAPRNKRSTTVEVATNPVCPEQLS